MMFLDCPAWLDQEGALRCGLPAEVRLRFTMRSSDGPVEAAMIRCPSGHWFNGPIEFLSLDRQQEHDAGTAAAPSRAAGRFRDRLDGPGPRRLTANSPAIRHPPRQPEQETSRPTTAPAYYQRQARQP